MRVARHLLSLSLPFHIRCAFRIIAAAYRNYNGGILEYATAILEYDGSILEYCGSILELFGIAIPGKSSYNRGKNTHEFSMVSLMV
ncbi:MAG: hypothetical protein LBV64_04160 [Mediterranea sp.]|jgi:hypothetical protein|nr:hypothetical protein [Mediterranea sp.]